MEQENCCGHCHCDDQSTNQDEEECCCGHCHCDDTSEKEKTNKQKSS